MDDRRHPNGIESFAAVAGHPLHPMLVPFPIGLLVAAAATDTAFFLTLDAFWLRASYWLLLGGAATAVLAMTPGLLDMATTPEIRRRTWMWVHFLGNLVAVALAGLNFYLRQDQFATSLSDLALALSYATVVTLVVTGWAGGELSYLYRMGVARDAR